jgi:hypothetical protein
MIKQTVSWPVSWILNVLAIVATVYFLALWAKASFTAWLRVKVANKS